MDHKNTTGIAETFLAEFSAWAGWEPNPLAAGLRGSYARGAAKPDSDVDLVMIARDPQTTLADTDWTGTFGRVDGMRVKTYGRVPSLRVWYSGGLEVEFGLCAEEWAALPPDPGTRRVLEDGFRILSDREGLLKRLTADVFAG